ncbi:hypothetical protein Tco_0685048 [Tanacetum coccineum]
MDQAKNNEALGINLDLIEEKRDKVAIHEANSRKRRKIIYKQVKWSTTAMKQVMPRMEANLDPSGRDHMKLKSRLERELTNSKTAKEMKYLGHGTFVISRSVIYMNCKNPPGTYDAPEGNIFI